MSDISYLVNTVERFSDCFVEFEVWCHANWQLRRQFRDLDLPKHHKLTIHTTSNFTNIHSLKSFLDHLHLPRLDYDKQMEKKMLEARRVKPDPDGVEEARLGKVAQKVVKLKRQSDGKKIDIVVARAVCTAPLLL